MSIELSDYKTNAKEAVQAFWGNREAAAQKQIEGGRIDRGERAAVTGGNNMNGFLVLAMDIVKKNGLENAEIMVTRRTPTLPGYFRPTKVWDMLVLNEGRLIVAIEFKSHVGPSFGNNCNNRAEEVIGSAVDMWTAFREGAFGDNPAPFLGWLMLVEYC